jgi:hypothetical protein
MLFVGFFFHSRNEGKSGLVPFLAIFPWVLVCHLQLLMLSFIRARPKVVSGRKMWFSPDDALQNHNGLWL